MRILRKHKPVAAFGVGGYAAGPMMLATGCSGMPNVIFEPNAEPGFTNRVLANLSKRIATGYEPSAPRPGDPKPFSPAARCAPEFFTIEPREPAKPFRMLITGGSQGALAINRAFVDAMDRLAARKKKLSIVHQTGERDYNAVRTAYARREIQRGSRPVLHQYGGALCLGRPDRLPRRRDHRRGNRRRGTRRHLHSLRRRHRQPPIAQRAGNGQRRRGPR